MKAPKVSRIDNPNMSPGEIIVNLYYLLMSANNMAGTMNDDSVDHLWAGCVYNAVDNALTTALQCYTGDVAVARLTENALVCMAGEDIDITKLDMLIMTARDLASREEIE